MLSLLPASLVALFSLTAAVAATPSNVNPLRSLGPRATNRMCGSEPTSEEVSKMEEIFTGLLAEDQASNTVTPAAGGTIPVYFNVIYAREGKGYVGDVTLVIRIPSLRLPLIQLPVPERIISIARWRF